MGSRLMHLENREPHIVSIVQHVPSLVVMTAVSCQCTEVASVTFVLNLDDKALYSFTFVKIVLISAALQGH